MRWVARSIAAALWLAPGAAFAFPVTVLQQTGPVNKRYNIAVLGDGYRSDDQTKLTSDATTLIDDIFDEEPYVAYRGLFNIKIVQAVSTDRGAKGGTAGGAPNTVFGASFSCDGVSRLLCVNDKSVLAAAARDVPEFNLALVIVNDTKYGGSGGDVPCVSTNRQAAEIVRHELGHNLANLADEYETPFPGFPACSRANDCDEPNVTLRNARAQIKWLDWIPAATQVPTPEGAHISGVGLFEGARYLSSGVYRPVESTCKMRTLGQPFCPVCSEGLVRALWNLPNTRLIDDAIPPGDVQANACIESTLSVTTPAIMPSTLTFSWSVDGQPQMATASSFVVAPRSLAEGRHTVAVTVKDATPLVRNDPKGILQEQHSWAFTVTPCGDASVPIDSGAGDGASSVDAGSDGAGDVGGSGGNGGGPIDSGDARVDASEIDGSPSDAAGPIDARGSGGSGSAGTAGASPRRANDAPDGGCSCKLALRSDAPSRTNVGWLAIACAGVVLRRFRRFKGA
jgi:hypothetical protein